MTNIVSKELDRGRSVMKSIKTEDHGWFGIGSGCNYSPYGQCCWFFLSETYVT